MPIGPFGEIIGTTGTLEGLADGLQKYKSKVVAPRNPKLVKGQPPEFKVSTLYNTVLEEWFRIFTYHSVDK